MQSIDDVFEEYCGRRKAILQALTNEVDKFFELCDPEKENLCLYGYPDGNWVVDLPAEEVPPEIPEPALGINFARDGMQRRDWLGLVAVHSDSWLIGLAFYKAARLNREQRDELFARINAMPTCYELVSGKVRPQGALNKKRPSSATPANKPPKRQEARHSSDEEEAPPEQPDEADGWEDGEGDPCPSCRRFYRVEEFWIACDYCDVWYCGKCAKMTQAKAERVKSWKCPKCLGMQSS